MKAVYATADAFNECLLDLCYLAYFQCSVLMKVSFHFLTAYVSSNVHASFIRRINQGRSYSKTTLGEVQLRKLCGRDAQGIKTPKIKVFSYSRLCVG